MGIVTIHVYDEGRGIQQDFTCETDILLRSMRYFKTYLKKVPPNQDVEISVHCDVAVFAWLLRYAKMKPGPDRPALGLGNCLPVLISSNFLQMEELVSECVSYIGAHLSKVAALPLDMSSLADELHGRLAKEVSEEKLEALWKRSTAGVDEGGEDEKRRVTLVNKLYKHKLEDMLRTMQTTLVRCAQCQQLFSLSNRSRLTCTSAKMLVDYRGNIVAQHSPEPQWRFQKYLLDLRKEGHSWREIYWHIWGHIFLLHCKGCGRHFPACQKGHCTFHPKPPSFQASRSTGSYPCCGLPAFRFDTTYVVRQGCAAKDHEIDQDGVSSGNETELHARVLHLLERFTEEIAVPWQGQEALQQQQQQGGGGGEDEDEDAADGQSYDGGYGEDDEDVALGLGAAAKPTPVAPSSAGPRSRAGGGSSSATARRQQQPLQPPQQPRRPRTARSSGSKAASSSSSKAQQEAAAPGGVGGSSSISRTLPGGPGGPDDSAAVRRSGSGSDDSGSDSGDDSATDDGGNGNRRLSYTSLSASTPTDSDSDDALSADDDFKAPQAPSSPLADTTAETEYEEPEEEEGEPPPARRSFLASVGAGRYTNSIRKVTENTSSRVKPALQAAMFQELIRQDDADRIEELEAFLLGCRTGPVPSGRPQTGGGGSSSSGGGGVSQRELQQRPRTSVGPRSSASASVYARPTSAGTSRTATVPRPSRQQQAVFR